MNDDMHTRRADTWSDSAKPCRLTARAALALKEKNPAAYSLLVADAFGVDARLTNESCFADTAPREELNLWFVSVPSNSELDAAQAPLAPTHDEAIALAVSHLQLEQRFLESLPTD